MESQSNTIRYIFLTNEEVSKRINMPVKDIEKFQQRLKELNILTIIPVQDENGIHNVYAYDLSKLSGNAPEQVEFEDK